MASNDGSRLTVFGFTFRQYDSRHMQQILRSYARLPPNPGNRAALYTGLFGLSRDLEDDEAEGITSWLTKGGNPDDFPTPRPATPVATSAEDATELSQTANDVGDHPEDQDLFEEYNPADFEDVDTQAVEAAPTGLEDGMVTEPLAITNLENAEDGPDTMENEVIIVAEPFNTGNLHDIEDGPDTMRDEEASNADIGFGSTQIQYEVPEEVENECWVCYEATASADLLVPSKLTSTCDHDSERRTCFPCLAEHINTTLERFALHSINCPFCDEKLSLEEIKKYAKPEDFARYEYLMFINHPDTVMCLGPGCGKGQIHTDSNPRMVCNTCSFSICVQHRLPWHDGMTCEEFDCDDAQIERLEEAEATAKLLAKDQSKICPDCKQGVSKQDGCDHLSCLCGKQWCFVCLASWEDIMRLGDEAHAPTCDYHPRKVQKTKAHQAAAHAQLTERLMGGPATEALLRARGARNERIRTEIRPKALEAAEARMKAEQENHKEQRSVSLQPPKKRTRLIPAWEER